MKRRLLVWCLVASLAVLAEAFFIQSLHVVSPSLLVPAILYTVSKHNGVGIGLALWLGFLLDAVAVGPFGLYMVISSGMLMLARALNNRGLEFGYMPILFAASSILLGWQYVVFTVVGFMTGTYEVGLMSYLITLFIAQILVTALSSFVLLRLMRV